MRWLSILIALWSMASSAALGAAQGRSEPQRIIALSPHATEMVYAAGAGGKLVATVAFSDYPPEAADLPKVGDAARLDREHILALRPDLVVAWTSGNRAEDLAWLETLGIRVYRSDPAHLADIPKDIESIGQLAGTADMARRTAETFRTRMRQLKAVTTGQPLRVFYQLWDAPLMTLGGRHIISELIALCGGENLFAGLSPLSAEVDVESVIRGNPQVMLAGVETDTDGNPFARWRQWPSIDAVADGRLFKLPADLVHRPGPRLLEGAQLICGHLNDARQRDHQ